MKNNSTMYPLILFAIFVATPVVRAFVDPRDFESDFNAPIPKCNSVAHHWIRAAFHDAGTFNLQFNDGGADGSLQFELDRRENKGLDETIDFYKGIVARRGISMADAIAFGGVRAFIACGSPAINFRPGRIDATGPNPTGRLPDRRASANETLKLFVGNLGMSVEETVAIVGGGHTVADLDDGSDEDDVDDSGKEDGFDSTPFKFDNRWFVEILANPDNAQIESDANMLNDPEMKRIFEFFAAANENFFRPFMTSMEKMINAGAKFESSPSPAPAPQPAPAPAPQPSPAPAPQPSPVPEPNSVYYPGYYYPDGGAQQLNAEASSAASLVVAPLVFLVSIFMLWL
jgi:L-ascorbate peroxidase